MTSACFLVIAFAAVVMFPYLPGAESPAFQGVSLFVGVLFSLGSSGALGHIVAGVVLTYTNAFRLGDRVQIGDTVGDVVQRTTLVDPRMQWGEAGNVWHNAAVRTTLYAPVTAVRRLLRQG